MARPIKYSTQSILTALAETKGAVYLAAARLGCNVKVLYRRARSTAAVADLIQSERGKAVDTAELKLYGAVLNGEPWAIQMCLKTLGKDRGYVERTEHRAVSDAELDAAIDAELALLAGARPAAPAGLAAPPPPNGAVGGRAG